MKRIGGTILLACLVVSGTSANAQNQYNQDHQLKGGIQYEDEQMPTRLTRTQEAPAPLSSELWQGVRRVIEQRASTDDVVDSSQFAGGVNQNQMQSGVEQNQLPPENFRQAVAMDPCETKRSAPYIWYQAAPAGYYDGSGTTKQIVMAPQLFEFGGKFADGTAVPCRPITQYNATGHAYRTASTDTTSFWYH